jgi:RNA polymerase sigma factor (sigma-70 family)
MLQLGLMGVVKAAKNVNPDRVKSLDAWVFLNAKGMMFNARQFPECLSLNAVVSNDEEEHVEFIDLLPSEDDNTEVLVDNLFSALPKREAFILRMIQRGYLRTEIARMFNLSSMRIGQLEKRGLERLGVALVSTLDTRDDSVASRGERGHVKHAQTISADDSALLLAA